MKYAILCIFIFNFIIAVSTNAIYIFCLLQFEPVVDLVRTQYYLFFNCFYYYSIADMVLVEL